jgi:hypothetical protein
MKDIVWNLFKTSVKDFQQNGASVSGSGSTNLVSKNVSSYVLSLASEYGALTETTSGQTTTLAGSLDGIPLALEAHSQGLFAECGAALVGKCLPSKWFDSLGRVSYSIALNSTPGSQLTGTATGQPQGNSQQVTLNTQGNAVSVGQITSKVALIQPPVTYAEYTKALDNLDTQTDKSKLSQAGKILQNAQEQLLNYQHNAAGYETWVDIAAQSLSAVGADKVVDAWRSQGPELARILEEGAGQQRKGPSSDALTQAALTFASAYAGYSSSERAFYNANQVGKPLLSFEYDDNRPANQPSNSVFRLIYGQSVGKWIFTGNGAASIYNSSPSSSIPGASRLRDIQIGLEADRDLGSLWILGSATGSATYYFQHQSSPAILNVNPSSPVNGITITGLPANATQIFTQKGNISIAQVKLALGSNKSNLRFPIAVTWSNRSELIAKPAWRGQIGISYDFDSLFSGSTKQ